MECKNIILLAGRPGSGKTDMMMAYANQYPGSTLIISEESTVLDLQERGLNSSVQVIRQEHCQSVDLTMYSTMCIDYLELFDPNVVKNMILEGVKLNMRIILVSHMRRECMINNIFEKLGLYR